jgi:hypothetical protein
MGRVLRAIAVCLLLGTVQALGQSAKPAAPQRQPEREITDPDEIISALHGLALSGILFQMAKEGRMDEWLVRMKLTNRSRWDTLSRSAGGVWEGDTPTGFVSLRVWAPAPLNQKMDEALIVFTPATERPMPDTLLSHLLAKAASTKLDGATMLEIELASERGMGCSSSRTVKVRLDSASTVLNGLRITCDATK